MRTLLIAASCAALLPLTACVDPADRSDIVQSPLVRPPMMNTRPATFDCDDSGRVVVRPVGEDGRGVILAFANREITLKAVEAKEGHKYSDGATVFWMNGDAATMLVEGKNDPESCTR